MTADTRALRTAIIDTALQMNAAGINRGKSGNVSARTDGGFLITPSGLPYAETTPDDIVSVDRALRWGFNWAKGPFELLDALGPERVMARLEAADRPLPRMLALLRQADAGRFYRDGSCLGADGAFHPLP